MRMKLIDPCRLVPRVLLLLAAGSFAADSSPPANDKLGAGARAASPRRTGRAPSTS